MLEFPRQIGLKRSICRSRSDFANYIKRLNGKTSIYTSLYSFDTFGEYDSAVMDRAWWDFDMNDDFTMDDVKHDVAALIQRLEGDVRLVATGRGFHIHQCFKRPVRGREWAIHLDRYERAMADGLSSLDGVGYPEKMTRVSGTYNPKRRKWAVTIPAQDFAKDPFNYRIPERPLPEYDSIDPFKGIIQENDCFDLVKWAHENPIPSRKRTYESSITTVSVGANTGECALPTCLDRAIRVSNPPHHVRVALVQEMRRQLAFYAKPTQLSDEENYEITDSICSFIEGLGWLDYREGITRKYVLGAVRKYEHAPSPLWYAKHNLCNGEGCWFCAQ
tara:strand:- start:673 stop:1668 length:996 start_codon:yes stop_codon:yes gene_type:complete